MEATLSASADLGSWPRYNEAVLGFRNYWYPVMFSRGLRSRQKVLTICGERIAFFREDGKLHALNHLKTYPVEERAGLIWVYIGAGTPPPVEEDIPEELLKPHAVIEGFCEERTGNWRFGMENCIDAGHAKFLHRTAIWVFFREMGAWSQGVEMVPSKDGHWISRIIGPTIAQDDYPGLGRWPKQRFWKKPPNTGTPGKPNPAAQLDSRLPCICRPGHANRGYQGYQMFVPMDATHHRCIMLSAQRARGISAVRFGLKYWLKLFWVHDLGFQRYQDQRMIEMMQIPPERLYRPDKSITAWRRWCHETARTTPGVSEAPEAGSDPIAFQALTEAASPARG